MAFRHSSRMDRLLFGAPVDDAARAFDTDDYKGAVKSILERSDKVFHFWVFAVAALGFLTDSYNLFASNVILPAISYVYWSDPSDKYENGFNIATLLGTMVGQVAFGWYADRTGRQAVFGYELLIVVISTLGLLQSSQGYHLDDGTSTWHFTPWLFFWRISMGIGIGAAYPLSAVLAAEWSATRWRGRVMGAVFLMQPLGQLLACLVGLAATKTRGSSIIEIDQLWRIVIGIGAIPTLFTLVARVFLPESWRYTWFVANNPFDALKALKKNNDSAIEEPAPVEMQQRTEPLAPYGIVTHPTHRGDEPFAPFSDRAHDHGTAGGLNLLMPKTAGVAASSVSSQRYSTSSQGAHSNEHQGTLPDNVTTQPHDDAGIQIIGTGSRQQSGADETDHRSLPAGLRNLWSFLRKEDNKYMIRLLGVSTSWFLLDYAFYGMGFMSPATLAKLWAPADLYFENDAPWWQRTGDVSNTTLSSGIRVVNGTLPDGSIALPTINEVLFNNVKHVIFTTSCAALLGGSFFVLLAPYINRRLLLGVTYSILAVILAVIAGILGTIFHHGEDGKIGTPNGPWILVLFWILAQFFFSFGPNTLTFILPAEIFPARYRCTCYGIAAAAGKLGAVAIQAVMWGVHSGPNDYWTLRALMASFAGAMALGALLTCWKAAIPDTQEGLVMAKEVVLERLSDDVRHLPQSARSATNRSD